ncbi:MAG: aspartate kinase [Clostridia bacterium]
MSFTNEKNNLFFVSKFGGTIMANAKNINGAIKIILGDNRRRFVVVSAPGKRFENDEKITDLFYECVKEVKLYGSTQNAFLKIKNRFSALVRRLKVDFCLEDEFEKIKINIEKETNLNYSASRGEYLMAKILAKKLNFEFIDAIDIIKFKENNELDYEKTFSLINEKLNKSCSRVVIPGFYGQKPDGQIQTFTRGGSDFTASLIAEATNASLYENWKDVNGFLACDPNVVKNPTQIYELSYKELRTLSYMGAYVLHPDSAIPISKTSVPIIIKNAFKPKTKGTLISSHSQGKKHIITGIAGKKNYSLVTIEKIMTNIEVDFLFDVLKILKELNISSARIVSSVDEISLIICENQFVLNEKKLIEQIEALGENAIKIETGKAVICVVSKNISKILERLFKTLNHFKICVKTVEIENNSSVIFCIDNEDYQKTIQVIYNEFYKKI